MARWPRHTWTTVVTYVIIFLGGPLLLWLAAQWIRGKL
jgi:hypothetical protein